MLPNTYSAEVPFPLAGEGAVLRFRTVDLARLRGKYGSSVTTKPEYDERGNRIDFFWSILIDGVTGHDPIVIQDLLRHGLKQAGGKDVLQFDVDDMPFPLHAAHDALMDALFLARWGKTASQVADELRKAARDVEEAGKALVDPLMGSVTDSTSLSESSVSDTEPASTPENPGS